jgi:hypothetical protein
MSLNEQEKHEVDNKLGPMKALCLAAIAIVISGAVWIWRMIHQ